MEEIIVVKKNNQVQIQNKIGCNCGVRYYGNLPYLINRNIKIGENGIIYTR